MLYKNQIWVFTNLDMDSSPYGPSRHGCGEHLRGKPPTHARWTSIGLGAAWERFERIPGPCMFDDLPRELTVLYDK